MIQHAGQAFKVGLARYDSGLTQSHLREERDKNSLL
jgi:hypothetical protein